MVAQLKRLKRASKKPVSPSGEMELMEHLAELRMRIFRMILYVAVGMIITYNQFPNIMAVLNRPIEPVIAALGGKIITTAITDGFVLYMQVCFISGLVVAFPFVIGELWGFISPALTPEERRPIKFLAPFSALLFLAGVGTAYASLPAAYTWMASFTQSVPGAALYQTAQAYVLLTLKILLAFGVSFELPIVLLFLARIGIINSTLMTTYWRHATVIIAIVAAIITPSNDPLTMLMMAVPMAGLYLLSISLVRAFEPRPDGRNGFGYGTMFAVALAPIAIILAVGFWVWRTSGPNAKHPANTTLASPAPNATPAPDASPAPVTDAPSTASPTPQASPDADTAALRTEVEQLRQRLDVLEAKVPSATPTPDATPGPLLTPGPDPVPSPPGTTEQTR